jgi:uncharacterized protein YycO
MVGLRPGDIVLFEARKPDFMQNVIHLTTRSRYNHAALVMEVHPAEQGWEGDASIVEATGRGVSKAFVAEKTDSILTYISVPFSDEEDRMSALAWASARVGERYGYLNAVMCGVNNALAGLHLAIKKTDSIICSELVAEALNHAGFDFFRRDSSQISPGDLASFFGYPR